MRTHSTYLLSDIILVIKPGMGCVAYMGAIKIHTKFWLEM